MLGRILYRRYGLSDCRHWFQYSTKLRTCDSSLWCSCPWLPSLHAVLAGYAAREHDYATDRPAMRGPLVGTAA
ncbi:MAG: hypothetical protein HW403_567 [Dehalococcoidia bacterium]|nr:hypothetical protein [Dehalococcoidia bacterium]